MTLKIKKFKLGAAITELNLTKIARIFFFFKMSMCAQSALVNYAYSMTLTGVLFMILILVCEIPS